MKPLAPFSASESIAIAANVAKHTAHASGITSTVANARIAVRAIHASSGIGHSISASGIPTNTSAVAALTAILHTSRARNSSRGDDRDQDREDVERDRGREGYRRAAARCRRARCRCPAARAPASFARSALWRNSHGHSTISSAARPSGPDPPALQARPSRSARRPSSGSRTPCRRRRARRRPSPSSSRRARPGCCPCRPARAVLGSIA